MTLFGCILVVAICAVSSQIHHLKESRHLQALHQPHLPKDINVLAATEQFLNRFAQLKALADAAPDPPAHANRHVAVHHPGHQHGHLQHFNPYQNNQHQHHVRHQPQQTYHQPQHVHHGHAMVPVANHHGIVINPNRFPGPLAHSLPANVH